MKETVLDILSQLITDLTVTQGFQCLGIGGLDEEAVR